MNGTVPEIIAKKYFYLHYDKENKILLLPEENTQATERELDLCGYFVIITSDKMTAKEALHIYKSRDMSEKAFRGDKTSRQCISS